MDIERQLNLKEKKLKIRKKEQRKFLRIRSTKSEFEME